MSESEKYHVVSGSPGEQITVTEAGTLDIVLADVVVQHGLHIRRLFHLLLHRVGNSVWTTPNGDTNGGTSIRRAWSQPDLGGGFSIEGATIEVAGSFTSSDGGGRFRLTGPNIQSAPVTVSFDHINWVAANKIAINYEVLNPPVHEKFSGAGIHLLYQGRKIIRVKPNQTITISHGLEEAEEIIISYKKTGHSTLEQFSGFFGKGIKQLKNAITTLVGDDFIRIRRIDHDNDHHLEIILLTCHQPVWVKIEDLEDVDV